MNTTSLCAGKRNHILVEYITKKGLWRPGLRHPDKNRWTPFMMDGDVVIVVELTQGYAMIVCPIREAEELLRDRCYYALVTGSGVRPYNSKDGYFYRHLVERLHGEIPDGQEVDHRDQRTLNNTVANLRLVSRSENNRNRGRHKNNSSGYNGIHWDKRDQVWRVQCRVHGKRRCRYINPRKLGITKEAAFELAIKKRQELESEMGYHNF